MEVRYFRWGTYLMRFVFTGNAMYEEKFTANNEWVATADLSRPFYRGDTDLIELTVDQARQLEPKAFLD